MELEIVTLGISLIALLLAIYAVTSKTKTPPPAPVATGDGFQTTPLRLQAYERLALLCERIALPALISRSMENNLGAAEMKTRLLQNIKDEFEHNTTQQIYVSNITWDAVNNLKDQNMLIVNQVANLLPPEATAADLGKHILQVITAGEAQPLHQIVLEALRFEAKKLMA